MHGVCLKNQFLSYLKQVQKFDFYHPIDDGTEVPQRKKNKSRDYEWKCIKEELKPHLKTLKKVLFCLELKHLAHGHGQEPH